MILIIVIIQTWNAVIASSLKVEGDEVHAEAGVLALEEMVGQLLGHDVVELLTGLRGEANQELVQRARPLKKDDVKSRL
jgi:hypothetical protein